MVINHVRSRGNVRIPTYHHLLHLLHFLYAKKIFDQNIFMNICEQIFIIFVIIFCEEKIGSWYLFKSYIVYGHVLNILGNCIQSIQINCLRYLMLYASLY